MNTSPTSEVVVGSCLLLTGIVMLARVLFFYKPAKWVWGGGGQMSRFGFFASFCVVPIAFGTVMLFGGALGILSSKTTLWIVLPAVGLLLVAAISDSIRFRTTVPARYIVIKRKAHLFTLLSVIWVFFSVFGLFFFTEYRCHHTSTGDLVAAVLLWSLHVLFISLAIYYWRTEQPGTVKISVADD